MFTEWKKTSLNGTEISNLRLSCKILTLHITLRFKQWRISNEWTGNRKDFWVIALQFPQVRWYGDFNPCSCWIAIILNQDNIIWVKTRSHTRSRHFVPNDECLLLLSFDGQQHSVTNFSHAIFGVHMNHSWRTVVWCISQGTVVNNSHSRHLLNGCCDGRNTEEKNQGKLSLLEKHTLSIYCNSFGTPSDCLVISKWNYTLFGNIVLKHLMK